MTDSFTCSAATLVGAAIRYLGVSPFVVNDQLVYHYVRPDKFIIAPGIRKFD